MNKLSIILLIVTLMATQITAVNAADAPIIQVTVDNIHLTAGEVNTIEVSLKNTGDYNMFDVEAFLTSSVSGITILSGQNKVFNEISDRKTKSYEPELYLSGDLALGAYTLSLSVVYGRTGTSLQSSVTVPIGIVVDESYVPKITFTPAQESIKVKTGTENNVEFGFTNNWDQNLTNVEFIISSSTSSIAIVDNINTVVDFMAPDDSVTLNPVISITEGTVLGT